LWLRSFSGGSNGVTMLQESNGCRVQFTAQLPQDSTRRIVSERRIQVFRPRQTLSWLFRKRLRQLGIFRRPRRRDGEYRPRSRPQFALSRRASDSADDPLRCDSPSVGGNLGPRTSCLE
jgi:hypothetical protein